MFRSGSALLAALVVSACASNTSVDADPPVRSTITPSAPAESSEAAALSGGDPAAEASSAGDATEESPETEPATPVLTGEFGAPAFGDSPELECLAPALKTSDPDLLDSTRVYIHRVVYGTSRWFDGLFGTSSVECAGNVSNGYVGAGLRWDERDGTKFRARFRARVALPAVNRRARLIVGRGDADRYIEGTDDKAVQNLPERFNDFDDQDFLIGLGWSRSGGLRKGWDFGLGVKFSTPLDPYTRARYHINPVVSERWLWRMTPQVFWQDSRGFGVSLTNTVDHALHEKWMLRSWTSLVEDEVSEGMEWVQQFTAYQNVNDRSAFSYSLYATGETDYEVPIRDYGVEIRYRRSILREWFFIELRTSLSYPRDFIEEEREQNIGAGLEVEMQFGEWPNRQ